MSKKRKKSQSTASPLQRRLLLFWLPFIVMFFGMAWFSQLRYNGDKEARVALTRLNDWRSQAGVQPLAQEDMLQEAARNHALYLSKDAHGHDEPNRSNPYFTGETAQERATKVGYSAPVAENLTISNWARSGRAGVDGLMTALYHRLALLNPNHDEAGAAWVRGKHQALVIEQGSRVERELCEQPRQHSQARYVLTTLCMNQKVEIQLNQLPEQYVGAVKFPIGSYIEPVYDGKEKPNPMPQYKETGNPISIAFYGQQQPIEMVAFELFAPQGQIMPTEILTAKNDPNGVLLPTEFALFPVKPLDFNTEYRVQFRYRQNGQEKQEHWTFRTREKRNWLEF
ncbi:CAP domain-containing protein [Neisseriaceae bacterium B1]